MSLSEALVTAIRDGITERTRPEFVVVTQEQYDAIKADAYRRDAVRTPPPWGRAIGVTTPSVMETPVIVRAVGADISDLVGPVLDVRSIA